MANPASTDVKTTTLTASERLIAYLKAKERFMPRMYNDAAQPANCTVGYGHLVHFGPIDGSPSEKPFERGMSEAEADNLLRSDVRVKAEHYVRAGVKVELQQHEYDALCSFAFNCGGLSLLSSTLLKKLNAGDRLGAAAEFQKWTHAGGKVLAGLKTRRAEEAAMFLGRDPKEVA